MKIIHVLNRFLPYQTAGTEVYVWALSKQLQNNGFQVKIVIPNYGEDISENYVYDELQVHKFSENSVVDRSLIMGFRKPNGLTFFIEYLKEFQPTIVHFHELAGSNGITLHHVTAAKSLGIKVLFTFHLAGYTCKTGTLLYNSNSLCNGEILINKCSNCYLHSKGYTHFKYLLNPISQLLQVANINSTKWNNKIGTALGTSFIIGKQKQDFQKLIDNCDKVIALTKWYEKMLLLNGVSQNKINFIPQGLPLKALHQDFTKKNISDKPLRLIFLGRISHFKGLHLLIDALFKLPKESVLLDIYGQADNSNYEQLLKDKTKSFDNIRWCGKLKQDEVIDTMQQHHILCLCSTFSEMSPLVIQEAFAAGIPVLASNVYGNAEQIMDGKNGWLFKFNDSHSLKLKLQQLIDDSSLVEKAQRNLETVRNFDAVAKEQMMVYEKLVYSS
jgi:glycosyltransferase involved in cell wall biosynthesis